MKREQNSSKVDMTPLVALILKVYKGKVVAFLRSYHRHYTFLPLNAPLIFKGQLHFRCSNFQIGILHVLGHKKNGGGGGGGGGRG